MSTATLTRRPALRALPGPADGALVAPQHDPRPCVTNPPQWWDTGHEENPQATDLCKTRCPFRDGCRPNKGEVGLIRGGVAYDDRGNAVELKNLPHRHHDRIVQMRQAGKSFSEIGAAIRIPATSIRDYCKHQGICATEPNTAPIASYHDTIVSLRAAGLTWTQVADRIGKEREAVVTYYRRWQQKQQVAAARQAVNA